MIYYILLPTDTTTDYAKLYERIRSFLPEFRKKKAEAIIPAEERAVSALTYLLLCHGLSKEYPQYFTGSSRIMPGFNMESNGKPALAAPFDNIFFNMSHCRTGIACAIASSPIGVDIQDIRNIKESIKYKLSGCSSMSSEDFARFWSRYEAYVKFTGEGICIRPESCEYMSDTFLQRNNTVITTISVHHKNTEQAAAYLSAACSCTSSTDLSVVSIDFSDFCNSLPF